MRTLVIERGSIFCYIMLYFQIQKKFNLNKVIEINLIERLVD